MLAKLTLAFREEERPFLLDISSLLYDFELLHDLSLILCAEEYIDYKFSRFFWFRNRRPIRKQHRLRASRITKESPLTVELILAGITVVSGALWALLQAIEKIRNWSLSREKLQREIEKLKSEIRLVELERKVREREADLVYDPLVKRLEDLPFKLADLKLEAVEEDR